jgi:hypothetical protein
MKTTLMSLVVVAVAGVPGLASASTISVDRAGTIQYRAASSEANKLELVNPFGPLVFADHGATLTAGRGCTAAAGATVSCPFGPIVAALGDGDDAARVNSFSPFGGVTVNGADGDDDILAGANTSATANGGNGNDVLVLIANQAGTGNGGNGSDQLAGRSGGDALSGGAGADLLTERPGPYGATLDGDGGNDRVVARGSSATVDGGDGADLLIGGPSIAGGAGADQILSDGGATVSGGAGADQIDAADASGAPDTITCGPGNDTVWADADDTVAADCEHVLAGPAPGFAGTAQAIADAQALLTHVPDVS